MEKTYHELVKKIRDAVRRKALEYLTTGDTDGAIRILAWPQCKEADDWFGGLSTFSRCQYVSGEISEDVVDYEYTFGIIKGGSRVITTNRGYESYLADCYGYSALEIAHCSHAQDLGIGLISGIDLNRPYLTENNGYGPRLGALCVEIMKGDTLSNFCLIYVCCVSGVSGENDLKCAFEAVDVIKDFFASETGEFVLNVPGIPNK